MSDKGNGNSPDTPESSGSAAAAGAGKRKKEPETQNSQIYIGMPNGIVLCADEGSGLWIRGRFYHAYSTEPVYFENADQLIFEMESFFDSIHFPHPATRIRSFAETENTGRKTMPEKAAGAAGRSELTGEPKQAGQEQVGNVRADGQMDKHPQEQNGFLYSRKRERVMKDQELLSKHGDMGSFIIRVQQRQNSSMQGRLTWVEKNKTVYFRSVWELIRLIDSAVEINNPSPEEDLPSWEE